MLIGKNEQSYLTLFLLHVKNFQIFAQQLKLTKVPHEILPAEILVETSFWREIRIPVHLANKISSSWNKFLRANPYPSSPWLIKFPLLEEVNSTDLAYCGLSTHALFKLTLKRTKVKGKVYDLGL